MKHSLKRVISFAFVLILVMCLATPAFAAEKVFYQQGAVTVGMNYYYSNDEYSFGSVRLVLAEGDRKISFDKKSISVDPGTSGAEIGSFSYERYNTVSSTQILNKGKWKTTPGSNYEYSYVLDLDVDREGTATVRYSVDGKEYTVYLTIIKYINPLKSVTITGVKNGKNIVDPNSNDYVAVSQSAKTVKKARLKIVTNTDWVLRNVSMADQNTGLYRYVAAPQYSSSLKTATIKWGKLLKSHDYELYINVYNTKTHEQQHLTYFINGKPSWA